MWRYRIWRNPVKIFSAVFILSFGFSFAQDFTQRVNMIVVIDNNVVVGGIMSPQLVVARMKLPVRYEPGNLSFVMSELQKKAFNTDSSKVYFDFYYNEFIKRKEYSHHYKIVLEKKWLDLSFLVLRIYNMNKKWNRKTYNSLDGESYTYEMDTPFGSVNRIRKK